MRSTVSIVFGLVVLTACQTSTEPFANIRVATSVSESGNAVAPIRIKTTITNESNRAFTLNVKTCPARFRVETLTGEVISTVAQICDASAQSTTLAPGELYQLVELWSAEGPDGQQLLGRYRVIGEPFQTVGPQSEPVIVELPR